MPATTRPSFATRIVHTLVYFPWESEHREETSFLPWLLLACCLALGIVASLQNVVLGIALAVGCLYGSALTRYLISR